MAVNTVEGLDEVLSNLNREVARIEGASMTGLLEAGFLVQRASQKLVPIDTGNLRASAYTRKAQGGELAVEVGYEAAYAVYVHEILDAAHTVGQAKFLEAAVNDNRKAILDAIRRHARKR
jgi:hypothetical protein